MFIFEFLRIIVSVIMVGITIQWMLEKSKSIIDYVFSIKDVGLDKEYHFEYLKLIVAFLFNFILFKEGVRGVFFLENGHIYNLFGFIHNGTLLSFALLIGSIGLLALTIFVNRRVTESFNY